MFGHCKDISSLINDRVQLKIKCRFLYFLILWRPLVLIVCIRTYITIYNQCIAAKSRSATTEETPLKTSRSPLILVATTCRWRIDTLLYVHIKLVSPLLVVATNSSVWMYLNTKINIYPFHFPFLSSIVGSICIQVHTCDLTISLQYFFDVTTKDQHWKLHWCYLVMLQGYTVVYALPSTHVYGMVLSSVLLRYFVQVWASLKAILPITTKEDFILGERHCEMSLGQVYIMQLRI